MIIRQAILKLQTDPLLYEHGNSLRGYISNQFPQYGVLHNHNKDGSFLYFYPRVQYRIIDGMGYLIGIKEGLDTIRLIEPLIDSNIALKGNVYRIKQKQLTFGSAEFGIKSSLSSYCFAKPWLALNERNYQEYIKNENKKGRESLFKDILKGNLLSVSKSLGYVVDKEIEVTSLNLKARECFLKGTPMLGFLGNFSVNFEIPDYWGIGKSVSRGFGTVVKQSTD